MWSQLCEPGQLERKAAKRSRVGNLGVWGQGMTERKHDAVSGISGSSIRDVYKQCRNFEPCSRIRSWFKIEK